MEMKMTDETEWTLEDRIRMLENLRDLDIEASKLTDMPDGFSDRALARAMVCQMDIDALKKGGIIQPHTLPN